MSLWASGPRSDLPFLPNFSQLSDRVWRVMGLNPGKFTLQGTNTYLVGTGNRKVLIDCGDGHPDYVPLLIESLKSIHPEAYLSDILISHCHKDHWGGLDSIMVSELNKQQTIQVHKFPFLAENKLFKYFMGTFPASVVPHDLVDNQVFVVDEQVHIRVIHTPGHAKDHCAFYLEEEDTVFTADCILGHGSVAFEDLTEYMSSLNRIRSLNPSRLYPGHGQVVEDAIDKVDQYLSMRIAKEKQIIDVMLRTKQPMTPEDIVQAMDNKKEYHKHLMTVVVRNVGLHLIKLYFDGKVEMIDAELFQQKTGEDPYDNNNIYSILDQKWHYIGPEKHKL
ncbi:beta-lactamase-like protein [Gilbertella persicaria]|uniref:beta-lactamase-like protein n=1 Tax=Gilbertella persicaria TaxID=101096 RepID=UPI00221E9FF7|nr:beta-lactamase-like protein [Gilbertella persicaria]KAI8087806.1 beta-lactamase-like protein [Gilbertella persicaria]